MSFKRLILPETFESGDQLTSSLIGIGFRFGGYARRNANIEDTLIAASLEGLNGDGRIMSLLIDWIEIHHERINADRLIQMIKTLIPKQKEIFKVFWAAIGQWLSSDIRFARLKKMAPKKRFDYLLDRTDFMIQRNGEDTRFQKTCLRAPSKVFRHRPEDILTPEELAQIHHAYRFRILMGPTYRADMWSLLTQNPELSAAELARQCYGSYPTAFGVKQDHALIQGDFEWSIVT